MHMNDYAFGNRIYELRTAMKLSQTDLADMLGVDRKDTIAVGDSTNDSEAIKDAGLGLAMENACDELKQIADEIVCNNKEHVARYILENYIK